MTYSRFPNHLAFFFFFFLTVSRGLPFLEFSYFFYDSMDVGNLISDSSAFSKSSLNIWKFTVCILLKPGLENFEHYFASVWDECNCTIVWTFFGTAFLWDWNENWPFPVLWLLPSVPNCWHVECSTQYASKFGELSSGHRTGKDQFSFQSQRKAVPMNAQTTAQLHSSRTLVK